MRLEELRVELELVPAHRGQILVIHHVVMAGQIDVVVLVGVWDLDDLLLEMQQVLHIACLEVLREQLRLVIVSRSVV